MSEILDFTDDVILYQPLLMMTLIMSEEYQDLRAPTLVLSFNASSSFLSMRIEGFSLLETFIRCFNILCFFAIFVNPEFFTMDNSLLMI